MVEVLRASTGTHFACQRVSATQRNAGLPYRLVAAHLRHERVAHERACQTVLARQAAEVEPSSCILPALGGRRRKCGMQRRVESDLVARHLHRQGRPHFQCGHCGLPVQLVPSFALQPINIPCVCAREGERGRYPWD